MAATRKGGGVQVAAEVSTGLRAALEDRADREGLNMSIIVRKALMAYLGVDGMGKPQASRTRAR
jgi:hypothetical protein